MHARLASIVVGLGLALACAGCGGKAKPPPAGPANEPPPAATVSDAELEASMKSGMAFIEELATTLESVAGKDCATIAKAMDDTVERNAATIEAAGKYEHDPAVKVRRDAWLHAHEQELEDAGKRIVTVVGPCQDDPAVQAAAAKLAPP